MSKFERVEKRATLKRLALDAIVTFLNDNMDKGHPSDYILDKGFDDISYLITESEDANGSWYCSSYKAKQDLAQWLLDDEMLDEVISALDDFGVEPLNILTEPERLHVMLAINAVNLVFIDLLSELDIDLNDNSTKASLRKLHALAKQELKVEQKYVANHNFYS